MSLKPLIDKQKIRIDNHRRGTGQSNNWDDSSSDIHIDKTTRAKYNGKKVTARIRLPINSNKPPTFEINNCRDKAYTEKLTREIKEAFNDDNIRREFLRDLLDILRNYNSVLSTPEKVKSAAERLARHFGLSDVVLQEMKTFVDAELVLYTSIHQDSSKTQLFFISLDRFKITIGEIRKLSRYWRKAT